MKVRTAIYARYSSDLQSDASIEDQIRLCTEKTSAEDWEVINCYTDAGISGASLMRPGIQSLMQDAMNGAFDVVICEAMDRLSRDQEDIAGLYKRMEFAGIKIITLSEGEINTMHIGLKGTMNAMYLKDLADKTRRGMRGKVENGKSGGGIAYGYNVDKQYDSQGQAIRGNRTINQEQGDIICRIFEDYARKNKSPKAIAAELNKEGITSPSGKGWTQSSINGNRKRGTGILNNELYIGQLIWNRQKFVKNPSTGKRITRLNPESQWVRQEVPELRIVPQELWETAKARQKLLDKNTYSLWQSNRPKYLLSGLLKCGACGGSYSKINSTRYGCAASKNKGASYCNNNKTIKREVIENAVLSALQERLMRDDLIEAFCDEYMIEMKELRRNKNNSLNILKTEMSKLTKERENIIQAIKDGVSAKLVKDDLERVSTRLEEIDRLLEDGKRDFQPILHPAMGERYRCEVLSLRKSLNQEDSRAEASEHLRSLIEKIVLTPDSSYSGLKVDLYGCLAGILNIGIKKKGTEISNFVRHQLLTDLKTEQVDRIGSGGWI